MKLADIRASKDLQALLNDKQLALTEARMEIRTREVKNIRTIRTLRRDIARIQTILKEQK